MQPFHAPTMVLASIVLVLSVALGVTSQRNITVQELDPSITYTTGDQGWSFPSNNSDSASDPTGQLFALTQNDGAIATLVFNGTAVYYFSPLWPMKIFTRLSIDGGPDELVDLEDYSTPDTGQTISGITQFTGVRWAKTGLENKTHEVQVKVGNWAVVEHFVYTIGALQGSEGSSDASQTSAPSTPLPTSNNDRSAASSNNTAAIAGGAVGGVLGTLAILAALYLLVRYRKKQARKLARPALIAPFSATVQNDSTSWNHSASAFSWAGRRKRDIEPPPYTEIQS
ncbi:hypothetical protein D9758_005529 [Tetrapyrgos nigripes]|uniref:Uncharacterized protein n=1 Tax=Tetrapyrgos nigripes TaxID=182062 RepID=A0A8H5GGU9_9AGAR|nr:hypothetical protein D9758_005529 [Tetrapyrgos nigripes]